MKQKKREKAKAKAQQGKLAAGPPLAIPPSPSSLPSLGPSNASEAGTARSEPDTSPDVLGAQDAFQPSGERQLKHEARQPPGNQSTSFQQRSQKGASGRLPFMQAIVLQPAQAPSQTPSEGSADSESAPDGNPWLIAASKARHGSVKPVSQPAQPATGHMLSDGQNSRRSDAQPASAAAEAPNRAGIRPHSAVPPPGRNVERRLRGHPQLAAHEPSPGGYQLPIDALKLKKQRSKKGKLSRDGPEPLESAGSTPGMDETPLQLGEGGLSFGETPSSEPTPRISAAIEALGSHTPTGPSAFQQAPASSEQSEAGSASAAVAVLVAASGWYIDCYPFGRSQVGFPTM